MPYKVKTTRITQSSGFLLLNWPEVDFLGGKVIYVNGGVKWKINNNHFSSLKNLFFKKF